jgi:hypothetical protein
MCSPTNPVIRVWRASGAAPVGLPSLFPVATCKVKLFAASSTGDELYPVYASSAVRGHHQNTLIVSSSAYPDGIASNAASIPSALLYRYGAKKKSIRFNKTVHRKPKTWWMGKGMLTKRSFLIRYPSS